MVISTDELLAEDFNVSSLRVVDLKELLRHHNLTISRTAKKADLVAQVNSELLPKLREDQKEGANKQDKQDKKVSKEEAIGPPLEQGHHGPLKQGTHEPLLPGSIKKNEGKLKKVIQTQILPMKRPIDEAIEADENDTTVYKEYSKILKKQTNHKDHFSSSSPSTPNGQRQKPNKSILEKDVSTLTPIRTKNIVSSPVPVADDTSYEEIKPVVAPTLPSSTPMREISPSKRAPVIPPLASLRISSDFAAKLQSQADGVALPQGPKKLLNLKEEMTSPRREPSRSPQPKIEAPESSKTRIESPKIPADKKLPISPKIPPSSPHSPVIRTPEVSFDEEQDLQSLQHAVDVANEKIQKESIAALRMVDSSFSAGFHSRLICRLAAVWLLSLTFLYVFTCYREQRIQVGFCGAEIRKPIFNYDRKRFSMLTPYLDKVEQKLQLECVPCPKNAQCFPYSKIYCGLDYTLSKPVKSVFGLIPTYTKCVLDSAKVKKIDQMVKAATDILSRRNAQVKCGKGEDEDVGLTIVHLQNYLVEKLELGGHPEEFEYLWEKSFEALKARPELVFRGGFVRSHSLSKLSLKCRLVRLFVDIFLRLKWYLIIGGIFMVSVRVAVYKVQFARTQRKMVNELTGKVIEKLRMQAKLRQAGKCAHAYIGKVQLRDYYLIDPSLSAKQRRLIWERISVLVETNTNVRSYMAEVHGEMLKVWEWIAEI